MCKPPLEGAHSLEFVEIITGLKRMEIDMSQVGRTWNWPPIATYSPDGSLFLISDAEGQMHVLDAFSGRRIRIVSGHGGSFSSYSFSRSGRLMATVSANDSTGIVWDTTRIFRGLAESPRDLSPDDLSALWEDLANNDAMKAHQAIGRLTSAPRQALPWLREHLKPVGTSQIDKKRLGQLLAKLDNDDFAVREQATKEIEKFGPQVLPALEKALETNLSAEVRKRIQSLMDKIGPERFRPLRAVEALEHIGTSDAEDLLKKLANGAPEARPTQEAKASLNRLANRSSGSP
jgi:hypothetical protein